MSHRITHAQKEAAILAIKYEGTMKAGAKAAGVDVSTLNNEMRRSAMFRKRVLQAREEGHRTVADDAIDRIRQYAFNPPEKTDRNVLTAAIALANAFEPGFRGATRVEGRIEHDVRVRTAIPRPNYSGEVETKVKVELPEAHKNTATKEDKDKLKQLNSGEAIAKPKTVEEAIEGEIVNNGA